MSVERLSRHRSPGGAWLATTCGLVLVTGGACSRPGGPFEVTRSEFPVPDAGTPIEVVMPPPATCTPAHSSELIPPRSSLIAQAGGQVSAQPEVELTSDLYSLFKSVCGGCHVDSNYGNFSVTLSTFPIAVNQDVYDIITSDVASIYMPPANYPGSMPFSQRPPTDVVYQLATQLKIWLDAGSPPGSFDLPASAAAASAGYTVGATLGSQLTNIGSCVPNRQMVATNQTAMDELDAMFASATALPSTLDLTDLTTLDSATLAQNGVISYAPTYPLWSDNAQKMRYIRVPRGQSVVFDKAAQTLQIPPNTRFYKTFLKEVTDLSGNSSFRKIETRLIVSRPDTTGPDGSAQQNAIFGTYVWNKEETQASLLADPLRDGEPFADRIFEYVTDEQKAQPIIDSNPRNLQAALDAAGLTRHYALPGSPRCIQCHMGSPSASFVLGFTPLQVARRPAGSGGVFEPASGDELTQLQRLIDYGVITGMTSPSDVLPLEQSQGTRLPRNDQELNAQAYMVGNCAHCHNPRGYPSIRQPAVAGVLDFLPAPGPLGGIFQFPLERMSPIRQRGIAQNVQIPYITPSLYDLPGAAVAKYMCPSEEGGNCADPNDGPQFVLAPWRSLIYRNVDTPYDYFDDYAPFPHMPLNTSGYDCRVAGLMGDWMVSIPSRLKHPSMGQAVVPLDTGALPTYANLDAQPYEEVLPTDSDYAGAVGAAASRLNQYHTIGFRYGFCPSTYTADIVDPVIADEVNQNLPVVSDLGFGFYSPTDPNLLIMPALTPIRPDYISSDNTDPPGDWFPRRTDWATSLVNADVPSVVAAATTRDGLSPDAAEDLGNVITALKDVSLTDDVRTALLQEYPFGLWDTTVAGCDFTNTPTASSYTGASRPQWMDVAPPAANAPVFVESSGAAVFTTICFNCHGINADSQGLLADEISNLTGGDARVANLRDGLLGPLTAPGANRANVFGDSAAALGLTSDDLASRYMAFMTLGGTEKHLPQDVLTEVSQTPVVGQIRSNIELEGTPDMLRLGLQLCEQLASSDANGTQFPLGKFIATGRMGWSDVSGLVDINGDAEMWLRLCNLSNRQIVRVPITALGTWTDNSRASELTVSGLNLYWAVGPNGEDWYGANPVMDHLGNLATGVTPDNLFPLCVPKPSDASQLQIATQALQATPVLGKNVIPFCPDGFVQPTHRLATDGSGINVDFTDGRKWAARGAINAALAVFLYLDQIERDPSKRQPLYTQCNLIGTGK